MDIVSSRSRLYQSRYIERAERDVPSTCLHQSECLHYSSNAVFLLQNTAAVKAACTGMKFNYALSILLRYIVMINLGFRRQARNRFLFDLCEWTNYKFNIYSLQFLQKNSD
jgi:hypothetical protein